MYKKIINPLTGRKVSVNSRLGKKIIRNYINIIGGATLEAKEDTLTIGGKVFIVINKLFDAMDSVEAHQIEGIFRLQANEIILRRLMSFTGNNIANLVIPGVLHKVINEIMKLEHNRDRAIATSIIIKRFLGCVRSAKGKRIMDFNTDYVDGIALRDDFLTWTRNRSNAVSLSKNIAAISKVELSDIDVLLALDIPPELKVRFNSVLNADNISRVFDGDQYLLLNLLVKRLIPILSNTETNFINANGFMVSAGPVIVSDPTDMLYLRDIANYPKFYFVILNKIYTIVKREQEARRATRPAEALSIRSTLPVTLPLTNASSAIRPDNKAIILSKLSHSRRTNPAEIKKRLLRERLLDVKNKYQPIDDDFFNIASPKANLNFLKCRKLDNSGICNSTPGCIYDKNGICMPIENTMSKEELAIYQKEYNGRWNWATGKYPWSWQMSPSLLANTLDVIPANKGPVMISMTNPIDNTILAKTFETAGQAAFFIRYNYVHL